MYLILDIDGTLTNSEKLISEATTWALIQLQMRGHKIILATGRPTAGVKWIVSHLKMNRYGGYILSFNGARIMNAATKEVVFQTEFPHEYIPKVYEYAKSKVVGLITYNDDCIIQATEMDEYIHKEKKLTRMRTQYVEDFVDYVNFPINKMLMTAPPEDAEMLLPDLQKEWEGKLSVYRSEPYFIEMMPLGIDKAESLARLFNIIGVSKDEVVACGDGFNDISMIKYAGIGVAMANAQPAVKEVADFVTTKTNDENGLIEVIDKYFR